ncbi:MAG: hypothetical protein JNL71_12445 [Rhodospirillales bacterium]|nr:hypothetical protein [Rhodospirillales bacterium]
MKKFAALALALSLAAPSIAFAQATPATPATPAKPAVTAQAPATKPAAAKADEKAAVKHGAAATKAEPKKN